MYLVRATRAYVQVTPEGRYLGDDLREYAPSEVIEVCDLCEEEPTADDPLGHHKEPYTFGRYVIAHGQCGVDHELELA